MPRSARQRAMIAPPQPLPITMTSNDVGIAGPRTSQSAAHAFLVRANVGVVIVAVVAPARMVELDDVVAVVRADGFGEPQGADALPLRDRHARESLNAGLAAVVRHQ